MRWGLPVYVTVRNVFPSLGFYPEQISGPAGAAARGLGVALFGHFGGKTSVFNLLSVISGVRNGLFGAERGTSGVRNGSFGAEGGISVAGSGSFGTEGGTSDVRNGSFGTEGITSDVRTIAFGKVFHGRFNFNSRVFYALSSAS